VSRETLKPTEITIDREFRDLIPAMSDDERKQLEANIVEHGGAREPLVVWLRGDYDYVLLDGHNRYEICTRLGLPFECEQLTTQIADREAAMDWIDRNQLGRRNLSKQDYKLLLGRRYNRAKKTMAEAGASKGQNAPSSERTSAKLAKEHGVDEKTVRRAGKFQEAAAKLGIEGEIASGKLKASEAVVVKAAAAMPAKPKPEQVAEVREQVRRSSPRTGKGKASKPTAGESLRKNTCLERKATLALVTVRKAVEELWPTNSMFRDSVLAELNRTVEYLSRPRLASKAKPEKREPADELRTAVAKRWDAMRTWDKHWAVTDMKDVRRLFAEIIRNEQKQFD
jgi:hypothetical protein